VAGNVNAPGQVDFLYRSIERYSDWIKYEDAKAGAVLVVLAIGSTDLLTHAKFLERAHHLSGIGLAATILFWVAVALAAVTVFCVGATVLPYVGKSKRQAKSLYFFEYVASNYKDGATEARFETHVGALSTDAALMKQLAPEARVLAVITAKKVKLVQWAMLAVLGFIAAWAVARILLHYA
jgi:Family of unknown function (DUF5706)